MKITQNHTVKELQDNFQEMFKGLKIEFFDSNHKHEDIKRSTGFIDPLTTLSELNNKLESGFLEIDPSASVASFEFAMENEFGLFVQVFRLSSRLYLQTTTTDNWSLAQQNQKGLNSLKKSA